MFISSELVVRANLWNECSLPSENPQSRFFFPAGQRADPAAWLCWLPRAQPVPNTSLRHGHACWQSWRGTLPGQRQTKSLLVAFRAGGALGVGRDSSALSAPRRPGSLWFPAVLLEKCIVSTGLGMPTRSQGEGGTYTGVSLGEQR